MNTKRTYALRLALGALFVACAPAQAVDSDGDGVDDTLDNCSQVANADQRDSNGDGFGNICDADLNNDMIVNVIDLGTLKAVFFSNDADADSNGDGVVNAVDLGSMRTQFFGPPGPGATPPQGFTQRPARFEGDYDNNGVVDGVSVISYAPDGNVLQQAYTYTDDGTTDLFQFASDVGFLADYSYDANGNLALIEQDNFTSGNDFEFAYTYDGNDQLTRSDDTVLSAGGSVIFQQYTTFSYVDGLRVQENLFQSGTDLLLLVRDNTYDSNGLIDTSSWINQLSPGGLEFDFTWNADGKLIQKRTDFDADGTYDEVINYVHQGGRLVQRVTTGSLSFVPPNYTENLFYDETTGRLDRVEYDANSDGSVDAVENIVWEDGPCQLFFVPDSFPTGGFDGDPDSAIGDVLSCGP